MEVQENTSATAASVATVFASGVTARAAPPTFLPESLIAPSAPKDIRSSSIPTTFIAKSVIV